MLIMVAKMSKTEFQAMIKDLLIKRPELLLDIKNFENWEDWYGYGELDHGRRNVACRIEKETKEQKAYLKRKGFD